MKVVSIPKKVNGTVVRVVAAQVFFLSLGFLFTGSPVFLGILVPDFLVRALGYPQFSPLAGAGRLLADSLGWKIRPLFFQPKRFAASIGFSLSLGAALLLSIGFSRYSLAVVSLLGLFSFLEAFIGFCAGCKIYGYLVQRGWISDKHCPDCAF